MSAGFAARLADRAKITAIVGLFVAIILVALTILAAIAAPIDRFVVHAQLDEPEIDGVVILATGVLASLAWPRLHWMLYAGSLTARRLSLADIGPEHFGVHPRARDHDGDDARATVDDQAFVHRVVDEDMAAALQQYRFVVVIGDPVSGVSHTAWLGVTRHFPERTRFIVPATSGRRRDQSVGALLRATLPPKLRTAVIWVPDLGRRLARGEMTVEDLLAFHRLHPKATVIGTLRSVRHRQLTAAQPFAEAKDVLHEAREVAVPRTLVARELDEAAIAFPDVPEESRRRLPEYLAAHSRYLRRLDLAGESPVGWAISWAAMDWRRCGAAGGAPERYLRHASPIYLSRHRRNITDEEFESGLRWAEEPLVGDTCLLTIDQDGTWLTSPVAADLLDRRGDRIPPNTWGAVLSELGDEADQLIAIGKVAFGRGLPEIARKAWTTAQGGTDPRASAAAGDLLIQLADAEAPGQDTNDIQALSRRVRRRTVLDALIERSPVAMTAVGDRGEEDLFDSRRPRPRGGFAPKLYRLRVLRLVIRTLVLGLFDAFSALAGLGLALAAKSLVRDRSLIDIASDRWTLGIYCVAFALASLAIAGAYRTDSRRARLDRITLAFSASAALAAVAGVAHGEGVIYSTTAWASFIFAIPCCWALRGIYDAVSQRWVYYKNLELRVLFIGEHRDVVDAALRIRAGTKRPMLFVGYLSDATEGSHHRLGQRSDLKRALNLWSIHHVVIADPGAESREVLRILDRATLNDATVSLALSEAEMQIFNKRVPIGETLPLQRLVPASLSPGPAFVKRAFDCGLASVALLVLSPVLLLVATALLIEGGRPVLARPTRPGLGRKSFIMYKFRSVDPDHLRAIGDEPSEPTRLGALLRRFALDEVPQLFNVLDGTMSLVGPRPLPTADYQRMNAWHKRRYLVTPGMTGLWQISNRPGDIDYGETVRLDLIYMQGWSLWRDVEILIRTLGTILRRRTDTPTPWI
jgi:lipopolysaccharide/colanic/teichoic acid biosynthesis glycosyltransferase